VIKEKMPTETIYFSRKLENEVNNLIKKLGVNFPSFVQEAVREHIKRKKRELKQKEREQ